MNYPVYAPNCLLGSRLRILFKVWKFVSCVCCVLYRQRYLRRDDQSFRRPTRCLCVCLIVCDVVFPKGEAPLHGLGYSITETGNMALNVMLMAE